MFRGLLPRPLPPPGLFSFFLFGWLVFLVGWFNLLIFSIKKTVMLLSSSASCLVLPTQRWTVFLTKGEFFIVEWEGKEGPWWGIFQRCDVVFWSMLLSFGPSCVFFFFLIFIFVICYFLFFIFYFLFFIFYFLFFYFLFFYFIFYFFLDFSNQQWLIDCPSFQNCLFQEPQHVKQTPRFPPPEIYGGINKSGERGACPCWF